jgi:DeoR family fructose operon transcriptional repressor
MRFELRKQKILQLLLQNEELSVTEVASQLNVSDITIRRDFTQLEKENLLQRTHGGAMVVTENPVISFQLKDLKNAEAKVEIGKKAAQLVKQGDVVFIDCGSTTLQMCPFIRELNIKVITNSFPVLNALVSSKCSVNVIGGEYDLQRQAMHGKMAEWHIQQYHATKAFIGADAIDENQNLWANSEKEAEISYAMIQNSEQVYVLADSSKFGKKSYLKFCQNLEKATFVSEV